MIDNAAAGVADLRFLHFQPQAGAFARSLADAGEHAVAAVGRSDAGDQLGENHRFSQSGPAEQPGLAAANKRRQQVDDLDARLEQLGLRGQVAQRRRVAMDRPVFVGVNRPAAVDRLAHDVEHAAQRRFADRHLDRLARVEAVLSADQAVGAAQRDAAHAAAAEVLLHFAGEVDLHSFVLGDDLHGVVNRGEPILLELDVKRGADDLRDAADVLGGFCCGCGCHDWLSR